MASTVYPIIASYKAYDTYSRLATSTGSTTINVGGVSIPLGTIFKKATSQDATVEDDTLNFRLLAVQMWFIYWIVHAAICVAENVLFLKNLPLYSLLRLGLSLWLIAPIVVSGARLKSSQVLSFHDMQQEWIGFSSQGCGLLYFKYLKPFMDDNLAILSRFSVEPLLAALSGKVVLPLAQKIGFLALVSGQTSTLFEGYSKMFARSPETSGTSSGVSFGDMSEYDVVDRPESKRSVEPTVEPENPAAAKQSWFW